MTNIKIKFYSINNSRLTNDYLKNITFNGVQTKSSDRMYKFFCSQSPRKTEHKEKWVPVNTEWEN